MAPRLTALLTLLQVSSFKTDPSAVIQADTWGRYCQHPPGQGFTNERPGGATWPAKLSRSCKPHSKNCIGTKYNQLLSAYVFLINTFQCLTAVSPKINRLTPNDPYMGRNAPLTSKRCILYIYSTNIGTEYFKRALYSPFFSLQNAVCFIILTCLVPVLFTFYIEGVLN